MESDVPTRYNSSHGQRVEGVGVPDPALLALIQHFASPPPALIEPVVMADAEPFLSAFEAIAIDQDRAFETWLAGEADMRRTTRLAVEADPASFTPEMFDEIIGPFEHHMRRQKRITTRLGRRDTRHMSPRLRRLRERVLARQRRQFDEAGNLVQFLRDMREQVALHHRGAATRTPNETTVAAMKRARSGKLEVITLDDLRASIFADD